MNISRESSVRVAVSDDVNTTKETPAGGTKKISRYVAVIRLVSVRLDATRFVLRRLDVIRFVVVIVVVMLMAVRCHHHYQ